MPSPIDPAPGRSPPLPGSLRAAAAALLLATVFLSGCEERRADARLAALQAGLASAQAGFAVLSPSAPGPSPPAIARGAAPGFRPTALHSPPVGAVAGGPPGIRPAAASALLGAGPDALRRWFGDPDLRRREGDAEVLLFLGPGCALDVVLYAEGGAARVAHAAARADGAAAVTEADCLRGIGRGEGDGGGGDRPGWGEVGRAASAGHTAKR